LPLPVTALPQMSRPASANGMQAACRITSTDKATVAD
jgi:hypothetical protein